MGKRSSKDAGDDVKKKKRGKPISIATVLRPVLIGAAALALVEAVVSKVL